MLPPISSVSSSSPTAQREAWSPGLSSAASRGCPDPSPPDPLQVKIFEEDFQRERSDRERMNEEKEELKKQVEKLQAQVTLTNVQVRAPPWPYRVRGPWGPPGLPPALLPLLPFGPCRPLSSELCVVV